jgi:hypothetical protein
MIYLSNKFHNLSFNNSLVITLELKTKECIPQHPVVTLYPTRNAPATVIHFSKICYRTSYQDYRLTLMSIPSHKFACLHDAIYNFGKLVRPQIA